MGDKHDIDSRGKVSTTAPVYAGVLVPTKGPLRGFPLSCHSRSLCSTSSAFSFTSWLKVLALFRRHKSLLWVYCDT